MKEQKAQSYLLFITSMLIYGTIGIFRRYIPLSSGMLACARGVMGAAFLAAFVKLRGGKLRHGIGAKKTALLALSGAVMGFNWVLLFEAYNHTTVAVATLCYYMQPTIVILLSPLLFREKLTPLKGVCALVSVIGMVFVSGVMSGKGVTASDGLGIALGLGAAALYATVVILNKMVRIEDAYEKTVIQLAAAAVILIPYLLITGDYGTLGSGVLPIVMILIVGLIHTGVAYAMYFGSMQSLPAQSVAVLSYIDPVSALILSAVFLGERMDAFGIIGAVMIIGAALLSEGVLIKKAE